MEFQDQNNDYEEIKVLSVDQAEDVLSMKKNQHHNDRESQSSNVIFRFIIV